MVVQNFTLFQLNLSHDYDSKDILWEMLLQELSRIKIEKKSLKWAEVIKEVINSQILIDVITNSPSAVSPFHNTNSLLLRYLLLPLVRLEFRLTESKTHPNLGHGILMTEGKIKRSGRNLECLNFYMDLACVISVYLPLATACDMVKPKVNGIACSLYRS